jgi:hypothetical protein
MNLRFLDMALTVLPAVCLKALPDLKCPIKRRAEQFYKLISLD